MNYLIAHDLGTTGNKATLYDEHGTLAAEALSEYETLHFAGNRVEQKPEAWWRAVCDSTRALLQTSGVPVGNVAAISFSGQMMGCVTVDRDGQPLGNALIWADTRAGREEAEVSRRIPAERVYAITGHRLSASYSACKLLWLRRREPERFARTACMLSAKDFIVYRMTGRLVTDYSDASGTNLFDIRKREWSAEMLEACGLSESLLPRVVPSSTVVGGLLPEPANEMGLIAGTPVVEGGGDGSCASVGAGAVEPGDSYCVLGSSSWISVVSPNVVLDERMRTFNWIHLDPALYTPCGTMQSAGYCVEWFGRRILAENGLERLNAAASAAEPGAGGVLWLPYLMGERSPRWDMEARGAFVGCGASTGQGEMARAVMEGVGFNLHLILNIIREQTNIGKLTLIGGGATSELWVRTLCDIWQRELTLTRFPRLATSMGAAVCAGVGVGLYAGFGEVRRFTRPVAAIAPNPALRARYAALENAFDKAYHALRDTYQLLGEYRRQYLEDEA